MEETVSDGGIDSPRVGEEEHHKLEPTHAEPTHYIVLQAALVTALALIAAGVWWFVQPVSADRLYERIIVAADEGKPEDLAGKEGDIKTFLANYPTDARIRNRGVAERHQFASP